MPYIVDDHLPTASVLGSRDSLVDALEAIGLVDGFTPDPETADGTVMTTALDSFGGSVGTGTLEGISAKEPVKQTRDGLAVIRGDGTQGAQVVSTLPTSPAIAVAMRFYISDYSDSAAILAGFSSGGDTCSLSSVYAGDHLKLRMQYGPTSPDQLLDSRNFLESANGWVSVVYTRNATESWLTWEGGGNHPSSMHTVHSLVVTQPSLYVFGRGATPNSMGDLRHLWIFDELVQNTPANLKLIMQALKT